MSFIDMALTVFANVVIFGGAACGVSVGLFMAYKMVRGQSE